MTKQEIDDYVSKYVNQPEAHASVEVWDYGFCVQTAAQVLTTTTDLNSLDPPPKPPSLVLLQHHPCIQCSPTLIEFSNHLCPGEAESILTEDVLTNQPTI